MKEGGRREGRGLGGWGEEGGRFCWERGVGCLGRVLGTRKVCFGTERLVQVGDRSTGSSCGGAPGEVGEG